MKHWTYKPYTKLLWCGHVKMREKVMIIKSTMEYKVGGSENKNTKESMVHNSKCETRRQ